jgi:hypothetical protein
MITVPIEALLVFIKCVLGEQNHQSKEKIQALAEDTKEGIITTKKRKSSSK